MSKLNRHACVAAESRVERALGHGQRVPTSDSPLLAKIDRWHSIGSAQDYGSTLDLFLASGRECQSVTLGASELTQPDDLAMVGVGPDAAIFLDPWRAWRPDGSRV